MQITTWIVLILNSSICSANDIPVEDITIFESMQSRYNNYFELVNKINYKNKKSKFFVQRNTFRR